MPEAQVALYARVSSDQQARGNTIASQVAAVRERIAADTLALDAGQVFIDDGYADPAPTIPDRIIQRLRPATVVIAGSISWRPRPGVGALPLETRKPTGGVPAGSSPWTVIGTPPCTAR